MEDSLVGSNPTQEELQRKIAALETDLSKCQRAEEALRNSEERYRTLFEKSRDIILITTVDGTFVDVNQAAGPFWL